MTLVELCAGSAAVSLRWLHPHAKPPIAYQGGKRAYADAILLAMGLRPGGGQRAGRVVLVEAGPWGEAWAHWAAGGIPDTVERLRAWAGEDPRALWTRLKDAPVPTERAERVATWAVLSVWSYARKPIRADGARWRTHGFNVGMAYAVDYYRRLREQDGGPPAWLHWTQQTDFRLPQLIAAFDALPDLSRVEVHHGDVRTVSPLSDATVYIDPDYDGTTGYGHSLPRADVLAIADAWRAAGCTVAVSEATPLPLEAWYAHRLPKADGPGRNYSKQQSEWLTLSHPPVGVLPFAIGAA